MDITQSTLQAPPLGFVCSLVVTAVLLVLVVAHRGGLGWACLGCRGGDMVSNSQHTPLVV